MNIMYKKLFFLFIRSVLLITPTISFSYSNLFVLGDSLSDIGNFPEASYFYEKSYQDVAQHIYIPPTNPINTSNSLKLHIAGETFDYPLPLKPKYLTPEKKIQGIEKPFRSINWTQYLVYELFGKKHRIVPSMAKISQKYFKDKNTSINYAWWSAVTGDGCFNDNYFLQTKNCTREILTKNRFNKNIDTILVPGIIAQAKLLRADIHNKRVFHNKNSLYIIYAGSNGLYQAQNHLTDLNILHFISGMRLLHGGGSKDIASALKILTSPPVNAKKILIINLYDLSHTPRVVNDNMIGFVAYSFTKLFNHQLSMTIKQIKRLLPQTKIAIFDNFSFFEKISTHPFFISSLGKQCDGHTQSSHYYLNPKTSNNCMIDDTHGYLFWNNSHPSSLAHALLARAIKVKLSTDKF